MRYLILLILLPSATFAAGTVYFGTNTRQILGQSAGPSLIGTSTTNISTAAINFPVQLGIVNYWDGAGPVIETNAQSQVAAVAKIRRDIWQLQAIRSQAAGNATASEQKLFDCDLELLQRRAAATQFGVDGLPQTGVFPDISTSFTQVIYTGGPSSAVVNTATKTLLSTNKLVTVVAGAKYEVTATGPVSTALLGSTLNLIIQFGGVDIVTTTPVSLAGNLLSTTAGWWLQGKVQFSTATTATGNMVASTFSTLGTASNSVARSAAPIVVPAGAQLMGVAVKWGTADNAASIAADDVTIKRIQ